MKEAERFLILSNIDRLWKEHLQALKFVQQAVGLRGYAQRDPLIEYKLEGYNLFIEMMAQIRRNVIYSIYQVCCMFQWAIEAMLTYFMFPWLCFTTYLWLFKLCKCSSQFKPVVNDKEQARPEKSRKLVKKGRDGAGKKPKSVGTVKTSSTITD